MPKRRLLCIRFLCFSLFALSLLGCASRVTLESLVAINSHARVVRVCTRTPTVANDSEVWAHNLATNTTVSDRNPNALRRFAETAHVFYQFDPWAPRENTAYLPPPYHHMQCSPQSSYVKTALPSGLPELPISYSAREALVSILCQECAADPVPIEVSTEKRFVGQIGVPSSVAGRKKFTPEQIEEAEKVFRDAARGTIHQMATRSLIDELADTFGLLPRAMDPRVMVAKNQTLLDTEINIIDTPGGKFTGGLGLGVTDGLLPGGAVTSQTAMDTGLLPKLPQEAQLGKGIGEIGVGLGQMVVGSEGAVIGGGMTMTGGGAVVGVPLCIGGVTLATNGAITFCNGVKTVALVLCRWGDEPAAETAAGAPAPSQSASPSAGSSPTPVQQPAATPTPKPAVPPTAGKPPPNPKKAPKPAKAAPSTGKTQALKRPCRYLIAQTGTSTGTHTSTYANCTGQMHHAITAQIHRELQIHSTLKNVYKYRDNRFVTQAIDEKAHKGWPDWHREMERRVIAWLRREKSASPTQFEEYLRDLYKTDKVLAPKFPNGL